MRRLFLVLPIFGLLVLAGVGSAAADSNTINFESGYSAGNINGQNGWSKTGSYDVEVANVADFAAASGIRIPNQGAEDLELIRGRCVRRPGIRAGTEPGRR